MLFKQDESADTVQPISATRRVKPLATGAAWAVSEARCCEHQAMTYELRISLPKNIHDLH
jgi:hypothetical protein